MTTTTTSDGGNSFQAWTRYCAFEDIPLPHTRARCSIYVDESRLRAGRSVHLVASDLLITFILYSCKLKTRCCRPLGIVEGKRQYVVLALVARGEEGHSGFRKVLAGGGDQISGKRSAHDHGDDGCTDVDLPKSRTRFLPTLQHYS
jgi:hypothetical protein